MSADLTPLGEYLAATTPWLSPAVRGVLSPDHVRETVELYTTVRLDLTLRPAIAAALGLGLLLFGALLVAVAAVGLIVDGIWRRRR